MDFQYQHIEKNYDDFLTERSNGERVRSWVIDYCFPYEGIVTDGVIEACKKLQALSSDSPQKLGRTFFRITHKIYDGVIETIGQRTYYYLNENRYKNYSSQSRKAKIVKLTLKFCSFKDENETEFSPHWNDAMNALVEHIKDILGVDRNYGIKTVLTKVRDEEAYKKTHVLKDKYGVPFEVGDWYATGGFGSSSYIFQCKSMNLSQVDRNNPENCIIVKAKDPNKKLGWG